MKYTLITFLTILASRLIISDGLNILDDFISGNNEFASSLYKEILKKESSNFVVSSFSAEVALAFILSGAKGSTAKQLSTALHLSGSKNEDIDLAIKLLLPVFEDGNYSFHLANKLYAKKSLPIKRDFKKIAKESFSAEVENVDFSRKAETARKINDWVKTKTKNKIANVVSSENLDKDTALVLINALYLQGNWLKRFYSSTENFYENGKGIIKVPTIYASHRFFEYYEDRSLRAKFLKIPFTSEKLSMTFVLPNERNGLSRLENQIKSVLAWKPFSKKSVKVFLPKFKIESSVDFKQILQNMGARKIFQTDGDLSGISDKMLKLDKMVQKSFLSVNQDGIEAASATFIGGSPRSGSFLSFNADHPFIFYIRIRDVILFVGRVVSPKY